MAVAGPSEATDEALMEERMRTNAAIAQIDAPTNLENTDLKGIPPGANAMGLEDVRQSVKRVCLSQAALMPVLGCILVTALLRW